MEQVSPEQIGSFINDGFVRIEHAFSEAVAEECRSILWTATGCDPHDPASWTQPVIRIPELAREPFQEAASTVVLNKAFDQLAGKDNWLPKKTLGSFPIRFPSRQSAEDTGWHVDASFPGDEAGNYLKWRINVHSKGRALLMLFLFSDVSERDAPTRIRVGSHCDVAKLLVPYGETGLSFMELAGRLGSLPLHKEVLATGKAGTVYLCHPFIVHAAQGHQGTSPKFMAQPSLLPKKDFDLSRREDELCPVEKAMLKGLK
jgi:hypothetical protein